jgi:hypothetical protein
VGPIPTAGYKIYSTFSKGYNISVVDYSIYDEYTFVHIVISRIINREYDIIISAVGILFVTINHSIGIFQGVSISKR